jgi:hypothetical protein
MAKNKNNNYKNSTSASSKSTTSSSKNSAGDSMKNSHAQVPDNGPSRSGPGGD